MESVNIKRIYAPRSKEDGFRILVDRLWPRGVKKETAGVDLWLKEVAPTTTLRTWFGHDPDKWASFSRKYLDELKAEKAAVENLLECIKANKVVTLLYGAKDEEHNQAIVLQRFVKTLLKA